MTFNQKRASRMRELSEGALKLRVDARTLSSAAAAYELRRRGVIYHPPAQKVIHQPRWVNNPLS